MSVKTIRNGVSYAQLDRKKRIEKIGARIEKNEKMLQLSRKKRIEKKELEITRKKRIAELINLPTYEMYDTIKANTMKGEKYQFIRRRIQLKKN